MSQFHCGTNKIKQQVQDSNITSPQIHNHRVTDSRLHLLQCLITFTVSVLGRGLHEKLPNPQIMMKKNPQCVIKVLTFGK